MTTSSTPSVNDWQVNGLLAAFSGTPFTVTANGDALNTPSNTQTADLVGTFTETGNIGAAGTWFDTTAFAQPTGVRFGNTGRNQFRGPGGWNLDFSVFRSFPIGGDTAARVPAPGWQRVQPSGLRQSERRLVDDGNFGRITGIANQYPERQVQMGLRFSF